LLDGYLNVQHKIHEINWYAQLKTYPPLLYLKLWSAVLLPRLNALTANSVGADGSAVITDFVIYLEKV